MATKQIIVELVASNFYLPSPSLTELLWNLTYNFHNGFLNTLNNLIFLNIKYFYLSGSKLPIKNPYIFIISPLPNN